MTVDFAYKLMKFIINKDQNGYLSPDDFNTIINQAQFSLLDYLCGQFQTYQVGRPISKVQFGMNETARQRLTPFINELTNLEIDNTGFAAYPPAYQQMDAMFDSTKKNRIRFVPKHKLYSYLNSVIDPVVSNPIYIIVNNGFIFYPNSVQNGVTLGIAYISYVSTPPPITWAYIPDANGRPVYDPSHSNDPLWYDVDMLDIISRALKMVGVNLESPLISQYAGQIIQAGQ